MMQIENIAFFYQIPPELATFFIAMLPIFELRGSIPIALGIFNLSAWNAFFWSVLGNLTPVLLILYCIEPVTRYVMRKSQIAKKFFEWLFAHTRNKFSRKFLKYGQYALVVFVAIPFPATGAWSGSLAAFLFGIPPLRAMALISIGVILAGIIVIGITKGIIFVTI